MGAAQVATRRPDWLKRDVFWNAVCRRRFSVDRQLRRRRWISEPVIEPFIHDSVTRVVPPAAAVVADDDVPGLRVVDEAALTGPEVECASDELTLGDGLALSVNGFANVMPPGQVSS